MTPDALRAKGAASCYKSLAPPCLLLPYSSFSLYRVRTAADLPDNVRGLIVRGRDAWTARDYPRARHLFEAALTVAQEAGDRFAQAAAYHFLGNVAFNESDDAASRRFHLAALELSRADHDAQGEATSLGSIALVDVSGGDLSSARTNYKAAVAAYYRAGMSEQAIALREKADALLEGRVAIDDVTHRA